MNHAHLGIKSSKELAPADVWRKTFFMNAFNYTTTSQAVRGSKRVGIKKDSLSSISFSYSIRRPGRLFNFWTLFEVGASLRPGT